MGCILEASSEKKLPFIATSNHHEDKEPEHLHTSQASEESKYSSVLNAKPAWTLAHANHKACRPIVKAVVVR